MWNDLQLIHYVQCADDSPNFIKQLRGIVVDVGKNRIVCRSTPFTTEIVTDDLRRVEKYIPPLMNNVCVNEAAEGTVIRVFFDGCEWLWTTHHNLDAYDSRWGNTTFGAMFEECLNRAKPGALDKDICYAFLMSHSENTIVCHDQDMCKLYLIGAYDRTSLNLDPLSELPKIRGIETERTIYCSLTREDLLSMTNRANIADTSGFIVQLGKTHIKISNPQYMMFRSIRGDNPNLNIRYLELTRSGNTEEAQKFVDMYARYHPRFIKIEDEMRQLYPIVYNMYVDKYITKRATTVPSTEYIAVKYIHHWHVQNRRMNVVTKERIARLIGQMSAVDIWKLIRDRVIVK
jgi:hypothetical protein